VVLSIVVHGLSTGLVAARYESAEAAVGMAEPAMKLTMVIESTQDPAFVPRLIPLLATMPLVKIISPTDPRWLSTLDAIGNEVTRFISTVRVQTQEQIVAAEEQGAKLESLLEGEAESAGSLMNTEFLALDENLTVAQAIEEIRQYPRKESFFYVYCVDDGGHLVGVLSLRNLILARVDAHLKDLMVQSVVRTQVESTPEEVAQIVSKYDLLSVPVVDLQNRLVGVVTVDDIIDVIQEQAEEDLMHLAGVAAEERVSTPAMQSTPGARAAGWPRTGIDRSTSRARGSRRPRSPTAGSSAGR